MFAIVGVIVVIGAILGGYLMEHGNLRVLMKLPNKISIEGHTDSKPFSGKRNYGNWELSTDRANSARRMMQQEGLGPKQVAQVRGFADQLLRNATNPRDPSNRRISLIVQYLDKEDQHTGVTAQQVEKLSKPEKE